MIAYYAFTFLFFYLGLGFLTLMFGFFKRVLYSGLVVGKRGVFFLMKSLSTSSTAFNYCNMAVVILSLRLHKGAM